MRSVLLLVFACLFVASVSGLSTQATITANDIATLQYALTLENIEADFYSKGQALFTSAQFINAGFTAADYTYFNMIRDHENAHVNFLAGVISGLGAIPVAACNTSTSGSGYNYAALGLGDPFAGSGSVTAYVAIAAALEPLGTNAYVTAATFITSRTYLQAAVTIATVEARHAQYVLHLNNRTTPATGDASFPIRDLGLTVASVSAAVTALNATCAGRFTAPVNLLDAAQQAVTLFSLDSTLTASSVLAGSATITANDNAVLQYALYLEYFEAAFYAAAVGVAGSPGAFNATTFANAGYAPEVFVYLQLIAAHEAAHVNILSTALGTASIGKCNYNFSSITTGTVANFINTAATLEPVGVSAYDGVANAITARAYLQVAAGIATVEARHASILALFALNVSASSNNIAGPFPNTFDPALAPADVRTKVLATGFLTEVAGCTPSILPARVYNQFSAVGAAATIAPTGPTATAGPTSVATASGATAAAPTTTPTKHSSSAALVSVSAIAMMVVAVFAL